MAVDLLKKSGWVEVISVSNGIDVRIESKRAAELNKMLVMNGIDVSSFAAKRTLEDYFLKITEGASEV